jgi:Uma2 family endonuclease
VVATTSAVTTRSPATTPLATSPTVASPSVGSLPAQARIYAAAAAAEYWVVDLTRDLVHVHTEPGPGGYASIVSRPFAEPLEAAGVPVRLAELLAD